MPFRLGESDRPKFGLDGWINYDVRAISVADLEELSERFDFDPADWPEALFGQLTLDQAGDPDAKPKAPRWRNRAIVWMLLRQNGVDISWNDAGSVAFYNISYQPPEPETTAEPGKGAASPASTASARSAASTTGRLGKSSTTRRSKSTP